jgi:O-antigen/teichoic acid export membrane protein
MSAVGTALIPLFAGTAGTDARRIVLGRATRFFAISSLMYCAVLVALAPQLIDWAYGGRYVDHAAGLRVLAILPVFVAMTTVLTASFRAKERPDLALWPTVASSATALALGATLVPQFGVVGAAVGIAAAYGMATVTSLILERRLRAALRASS